MYELADDFFVQIDELFEDWNARLAWNRTNVGRVFGLAALGHMCNYLDTLRGLSATEANPYLSSLVKRHCDECWATAICLILGDESDVNAFFGHASRMERYQLARRAELVDQGVISSDWPEPPRQFSDFESDSWSFESVFARAADLLRESEIATGADHLYDTVYRPLSNQLGAHPTAYVFDPYISRGAVLVRLSRTPVFEGTGELLHSLSSLNFVASFVTTILCAIAAAKKLDIDPDPFARTLERYEAIRRELVPLLDQSR